MNSASAKSDLRSAFASTANGYERQSPFNDLIPLKAEIRVLRSKGASFRLIAELLQKHSVNLSREKVRRFYYAEIENTPLLRKRSKPRGRPPRVQQKGHAAKAKLVEKTTNRERGPRIARIEEL